MTGRTTDIKRRDLAERLIGDEQRIAARSIAIAAGVFALVRTMNRGVRVRRERPGGGVVIESGQISPVDVSDTYRTASDGCSVMPKGV